MIPSLKAVSPVSSMTRPIAPVMLNQQKAYNDNINFARKGEKLNINCNNVRFVAKEGQKLNYLA